MKIQTENNENTKRILALIFSHKQITRGELAEITGLSSLTVTKIISVLINDGIIIETEPSNTEKGRKPLFLSPCPDYGYVIGIDIGSYSIRIGVVDFAGRIIEKKTHTIDITDVIIPSSIMNFPELRANIKKFVEKYGEINFLGIGIGITGLVNNTTQTIVFCPNIRGYNNLPISSILSEQFKVPVIVDTSARCMALGEYYLGNQSNFEDLSFVSVGYSIAVGTIIDGKIFRGSNGFAGELGHVKVHRADNKVCTCGSFNCAEGCVTLPEMKVMLIQKLEKFHGYSLLKEKYENSGGITYEDIVDAVNMGDKVTVEGFGETIEKLSIVLADYINLFNPKSLVLGGGFFDLFPFVLPELERELQKQCLTPSFRNVQLRLSDLSHDGAVRGSAMQIIQTAFKNM